MSEADTIREDPKRPSDETKAKYQDLRDEYAADCACFIEANGGDRYADYHQDGVLWANWLVHRLIALERRAEQAEAQLRLTIIDQANTEAALEQAEAERDKARAALFGRMDEVETLTDKLEQAEAAQREIHRIAVEEGIPPIANLPAIEALERIATLAATTPGEPPDHREQLSKLLDPNAKGRWEAETIVYHEHGKHEPCRATPGEPHPAPDR